jgi:long-chain-fatty-acid--[acyl-carrier-protein] ligase
MIYFSGDNVFSGYLDTSIESPFDTIGGKKFYKTGDLGYLDTDGYLFITGRLKRFVKIAGEMVSLPFVEGILNKKFGSETELTLAVEAKEEKGEVKIVAFSIKPLELEDIGKTLREGGASNLVKISEVILVPAIPVLGTGKTDYKVLKGMIEMGK